MRWWLAWGWRFFNILSIIEPSVPDYCRVFCPGLLWSLQSWLSPSRGFPQSQVGKGAALVPPRRAAAPVGMSGKMYPCKTSGMPLGRKNEMEIYLYQVLGHLYSIFFSSWLSLYSWNFSEHVSSPALLTSQLGINPSPQRHIFKMNKNCNAGAKTGLFKVIIEEGEVQAECCTDPCQGCGSWHPSVWWKEAGSSLSMVQTCSGQTGKDLPAKLCFRWVHGICVQPCPLLSFSSSDWPSCVVGWKKGALDMHREKGRVQGCKRIMSITSAGKSSFGITWHRGKSAGCHKKSLFVWELCWKYGEITVSLIFPLVRVSWCCKNLANSSNNLCMELCPLLGLSCHWERYMVLERPEVISVGSRSDGDRRSLSFSLTVAVGSAGRGALGWVEELMASPRGKHCWWTPTLAQKDPLEDA